MPSVSYPTIYITKAIYDTAQATKKNWGSQYTTVVNGGANWWYYSVVNLDRGGVPAGYTFKWIFYAWKKNAGSIQYNTNTEDWYKTDGGLVQRTYANTQYDPGSTADVPAYNGETWYYWFDMTAFVGKTYTLSYNGNNGTGSTGNTDAIYPNNVPIASNGFTRTGYYFIGWGTNSAGPVAYNQNTSISHPGTDVTVTLYALWTGNTYTLSYNGNGYDGGSTSNTSAIYPNNLSIASNGFTRTGYTFTGWATSSTGPIAYNQSTTISHPGTGITLTVYAVWLPYINITFNNSGRGENITTVLSGISGSTIYSFPTLGNIIGYIFNGWMINNVIITSVTLTTDVILYANWIIDSKVSFSAIQKIFGGNYPIYISEYYLNNGYVYSPGGIGIPNSGQISLSQMKEKYKSTYSPTPWITMWSDINAVANMDTANGIDMGLDGVDDNFASIGTVGFPFFWFGVDYGSTNNIQWTTNNVMTFGGGSIQYTPWSSTVKPGVLMGQSDRRTKLARQFTPVTENGYKIKRFIVRQYNYFSDEGNGKEDSIRMEILLVRAPTLWQYILIRMNYWNTNNTSGIWDISDGVEFKNTFVGTPPVGTGYNVLLVGSLTGTNWVSYNFPYIDAITIMGANLLLYHTAYNIDAYNNSTFSSGSFITSWKNIGNSTLTTSPSSISQQPTYTEYGVVFSSGKALVSTINLHSYPQMNIFIVLKKTSVVNNTIKYIWTVSNEGNRAGSGGAIVVVESIGRRLFYIDNVSSNGISYIGFNVGEGQTYNFIYKFPLSSIVVINCEYNSPGNLGRFSINGESVDFYNGIPITNVNIKLYIGALTANGGTESFLGTIHEFIVINRLLTDTERRNIYNLLYNKWNVDVFDDIKGMGKNLILRNDAKNVDGDNNTSLISGSSTISKWYNSATSLIPSSSSDSLLVTTQTDVTKQPTYTNNSVVFTTGKGLVVSNLDLSAYPLINIFIAWKMTTAVPANNNYYLISGFTLYRSITMYPDNTIQITYGYGGSSRVTNPISLNTTSIYNLEYNSVNEPGKFFINDILKLSFTSLTAGGTSLPTYIGNYNYSGTIIGNIYEIIIINRLLTDTERTNIYNILKTKWNVP